MRIKSTAVIIFLVGIFILPKFIWSKPIDISDNKGAYVVILHGIGRTSRSMNEIEKKIAKAGYIPINIDYPSRKHNISELATWLDNTLKSKKLNKSKKIHFVTHSMGGILTRKYIEKYRPENLGRVVMLSPPNQGSEVVDFFKTYYLFKKFYGAAGQEMGTDNPTKKVNFELGIIAGDRTIDYISSFLIIPDADDGKVAVERTKIDGMSDHITLHTTHAFMMKNDNVIKQILYFIEFGKFSRED